MESVDQIAIEAEENGWHLVIDTDEEHYRFLLPHTVAVELDRSLGPVRVHEDEGQAVRREMVAGIAPPGFVDPDEAATEALAEAVDLRRKADRENLV